MEAKDTVMSFSNLDYYWRRGLAKENDHNDAAFAVAKAQAEISFKAGYKQAIEDQTIEVEKAYKLGIREVVEFVVANKMIPLCDYRITGTIRQDEEHRKDCRKCAWQAKLKEWGD